jgi:ACR3 family arsenite transporter
MTGPTTDDPRVIGKLSALDRYLPVWILIAMAVGLLLGRTFGGLNDTLDTIKIDTV